MAASPAAIATAPNTMPAIAARGLLASPRLTRRLALSPVNTATTPSGTPISSQHVASANPPRITEATPSWFLGASGWLMLANLGVGSHSTTQPKPASVILGGLALATCWLLIGVPLGVVAVLTGDSAKRRVSRGEASNPRAAIAAWC